MKKRLIKNLLGEENKEGEKWTLRNRLKGGSSGDDIFD